MIDLAPLELPRDGKLVQNITRFARALRKAGLPLGTGRVVDAIRAVQTAGFTRRDDFDWTLHACFVSRPDHRLLFDQMFRLYWRDPKYIERMMALLTPLLRWDGFAPKARGIALLLPHVTRFRAGHNIASLEALGAAISRTG